MNEINYKYKNNNKVQLNDDHMFNTMTKPTRTLRNWGKTKNFIFVSS